MTLPVGTVIRDGVAWRAGRRLWSAKEDAVLRRRYPHERTDAIARAMGRSVCSTYNRALGLGLRKSEAYLASPAACRLRREASPASVACRFPKGHVPANKGLRRPGWAPGRMRETQFKAGVRQGVAAKNWCPVGTIRLDADGYQRIKVREGRPTDTCYGFGNVDIWPMLNRHLWAQAHGPIPPGHSVVFKDGNRAHCTLDNLVLISRRELMSRNTIHRLPKPVKDVVRLLSSVNRQIRKKERHACEK